MIYLFFQTWIWILLAGLLGLLIGWLIWGRDRDVSKNDGDEELRRQLEQCQERCVELESSAQAFVERVEAPAVASVVEDAWRPAALSTPAGDADDLKRIKGVGPVIEKTLNELGIYHFSQIGEFTADNVKWVDHYIDFPGRINREDWVSQAQLLAKGSETEFSNRYDNKT